MEAQEKGQSLPCDEVHEIFQDFLDSMTAIDELTRQENSPEEIDRIEEEIDALYEVGEEVYCRLVGTSESVPDNYADIPGIMAEEAATIGVPKEQIEVEYQTVLDRHGEIPAEVAWKKTRERVQRWEKMQTVAEGVTTVDDWQ